jgi:serine protein kinase
MYDEMNSFVSYVKDAAEGGSSKEMAYVLVGEPGNGKTFSSTFCARPTEFLPSPGTASTPFAST